MNEERMFDVVAEWQQHKLGKFSASGIHRLYGGGRRPMTEEELAEEEKKPASKRRKTVDTFFGETAFTYIKEKLAEILTQQPVGDISGLDPIEHGNAYENAGLQAFANKYDLTLEIFGGQNPRFFSYDKHPEEAGCSPDAFIVNSNCTEVCKNSLVEMKAPFNPVHHLNHLLIKTPEQLLSEKKEYYLQIQFSLMVTGKQQGYFVSYDGRMMHEELQLHVLEIPRNETVIAELDIRLDEAVKELKKLYSTITGQ